MFFPRLRRPAGLTGLTAALLLLVEGCAHVVPVARPDYPTVDGRGAVRITTREGRVYDLPRVAVDSSRFVGQVEVARSVVTADGHLEERERVEDVKIPFEDVTSVELRQKSVLGTAALVAGGAAVIAILVRAFQPADTASGGGGGPITPPSKPRR